MKKLLLVAFLVILALVLTHRYRVFVRDPLATVYQSSSGTPGEQAKVSGVQVYINYANDVLLMKEGAGAYTLLVQHWNRTPGSPTRLRCIHWMACLTDADQAAILPLGTSGAYDPKVRMTDRTVIFADPKGTVTRVDLR